MNKTLFTFEDLQAATGGKWYNLDKTNVAIKDGVSSVSTDTRKDNSGALFLALSGENFNAHNFLSEAVESEAAVLCLQKGEYELNNLPDDIPVLEVSDTLFAYQNLANYHRKRLKGLTLIAITGSNGKTSTKDILHGLLTSLFEEETIYTTKANTNNFVGVPQNILNLTEKHKFAVIELGSSFPGEIEKLANIANPDIAVITSIGLAHMEFFKDIDGVIKEKASIFSAFNIPQEAIAVFPEELKSNKTITSQIKNCQIITFGKSHNADVQFRILKTTIGGSSYELQHKSEKALVNWQVPGSHQIVNAAAAAAVAIAISIDLQNISKALPKCKILTGMRMSITESNGITWINDAYNANPASTKAGVDWLCEINNETATKYKRIWVVLGDMLELGPDAASIHSNIIHYAAEKLPNAQIYGVGPIMSGLSRNIRGLKSFSSSDEGALFFQTELKPGDLIFLKGSRGIALEKIYYYD